MLNDESLLFSPRARPGVPYADRRSVIAGLALLAGAGWCGRARSDSGIRLAAIDWAMAETAIMLGHPPVAVAELQGMARLDSGLTVPGAVDLGLRGSPNMEALSLVGPDLILSSSYYTSYEPQLQRIAPVFSRALFVPGEAPLPKVVALIDDLAAQIDDPDAGSRARQTMEQQLSQMVSRLARHAGSPCLLIELGDSRHVRVYGADSLFGGMIEALGLQNAWRGGTRFSFAAPVPIEELIDYPDALIVITGDIPIQTAQGLGRSALWNALTPVRNGRVIDLGNMNGFGGMLSALRFAQDLTDAVEVRA